MCETRHRKICCGSAAGARKNNQNWVLITFSAISYSIFAYMEVKNYTFSCALPHKN